MTGFYRSGQLKESLENGVKTHFFEDGTVKASGKFNGKMQVQWHFYKKTGQLWQIGTLQNDVKQGPWIRYHTDGSIENEMVFHQGKEVK